MGATNWVHLPVKLIVKETEKAFLLRLEDDVEVWMPKNQIADAGECEEGDQNCTVSVTEWICSQKEELEEYL